MNINQAKYLKQLKEQESNPAIVEKKQKQQSIRWLAPEVREAIAKGKDKVSRNNLTDTQIAAIQELGFTITEVGEKFHIGGW